LVALPMNYCVSFHAAVFVRKYITGPLPIAPRLCLCRNRLDRVFSIRGR
jgi:hypothetical protein